MICSPAREIPSVTERASRDLLGRMNRHHLDQPAAATSWPRRFAATSWPPRCNCRCPVSPI